MKIKIKQLKKRIFPLPFYVYLSYLVMCTLLLTGVSFSRYISIANGNDSAHAANGGVSVNCDSNMVIEMDYPRDGNEIIKQFYFSVSNNVSDVAIQYDVVVTLEKELPAGITMQLDGKPCSGNSENIYSFSNMGVFEAGTVKSIVHELTFTGNFDVYKTLGEVEFPINISVYAEQVD